MKKKFLLIISMLFLLGCLLAIAVSATEIDDVHYTLNTDGTAQVSTDNKTATTEIVTIPSTVEYEGATYKVTSIASEAFRYNTAVKELRILSEYITEIPYGMISNTYDGALTKIYVDFTNIKTIGSAAFNPSSQTNGNDPKANTFYYYDAKAFIENGEDVKITEPDFSNITSIGAAAFQGANFEKLTIPEQIYVNNQTFRKSTIKELVIAGESRTKNDYYAFDECRSLEKIVVESRNLTSISNNVFSICPNVKEIYIDLSNCQSVGESAFIFSTDYDDDGDTAQWYNLDGEKIVDLSNVTAMYNSAFASSNLGSATIIWPNEITTLKDQAFRHCNITQPIYINAAEDANITVQRWGMDGNSFPAVILDGDVAVIDNYFEAQTNVVVLSENVKITKSDAFKKSGSKLYYLSLSDDSAVLNSNVELVQITEGNAYNYGACGVVANVTTADGDVTIGKAVHTTVDAIDNTLCPVGKVTVADCKYCDYVAYYVDGTEVERKEHNFDLNSGATIGSIVYEDYFALGFKTTVCAECEATQKSETATEPALFVYYGYSATEEAINGSYSISQFYGINKTAVASYVGAGNDFGYGLVASANNNPLTVQDGKMVVSDKSYAVSQDNSATNYFEIKIGGLTYATFENELTFCAYVMDNSKIYYLDNGTTATEVDMKSYNEVIEILNGTTQE